jgi:hypothetical protein
MAADHIALSDAYVTKLAAGRCGRSLTGTTAIARGNLARPEVITS